MIRARSIINFNYLRVFKILEIIISPPPPNLSLTNNYFKKWLDIVGTAGGQVSCSSSRRRGRRGGWSASYHFFARGRSRGRRVFPPSPLLSLLSLRNVCRSREDYTMQLKYIIYTGFAKMTIVLVWSTTAWKSQIWKALFYRPVQKSRKDKNLEGPFLQSSLKYLMYLPVQHQEFVRGVCKTRE